MMEYEKEQVVRYGKKLIDRRLTTGSGGNISVYNREQNLVAISPSGLDYYETTPEDIVILDIDGNLVEGKNRPSSEAGMHLAFYKNRADVSGIVHTHSKFATAIACMGWELPAVHYLIGMAGHRVKCTGYATYGSDELAKKALETIGDSNAVLLANHGLIALGEDVDRAFSTAEHLEFVSEVYYLTKTLGTPNILSDENMDEVMKKFGTFRYR
ncbi:L-fuculose phosphate aldolase [Acetoanaerobium sticklandii]|uniref:L-fuculose phosphate aldolase n=1 Tax=Acetoanaerobium sticklandii (strain ATCC 12662 / DSM 519 / JCM 1433 / CCUG 9281 / NCIMB 10654 / HF) TaxID=499177 RepID=E3PVF1_ACESD|nr:L-fuculose-phosphate aldolase [Acetoanaerobium sticklandii]CBH20518.1 L-fuculose phosphate aldolase [Acetoanaerobium sticklandii]